MEAGGPSQLLALKGRLNVARNTAAASVANAAPAPRGCVWTALLRVTAAVRAPSFPFTANKGSDWSTFDATDVAATATESHGLLQDLTAEDSCGSRVDPTNVARIDEVAAVAAEALRALSAHGVAVAEATRALDGLAALAAAAAALTTTNATNNAATDSARRGLSALCEEADALFAKQAARSREAAAATDAAFVAAAAAATAVAGALRDPATDGAAAAAAWDAAATHAQATGQAELSAFGATGFVDAELTAAAAGLCAVFAAALRTERDFQTEAAAVADGVCKDAAFAAVVAAATHRAALTKGLACLQSQSAGHAGALVAARLWAGVLNRVGGSDPSTDPSLSLHHLGRSLSSVPVVVDFDGANAVRTKPGRTVGDAGVGAGGEVSFVVSRWVLPTAQASSQQTPDILPGAVALSTLLAVAAAAGAAVTSTPPPPAPHAIYPQLLAIRAEPRLVASAGSLSVPQFFELRAVVRFAPFADTAAASARPLDVWLRDAAPSSRARFARVLVDAVAALVADGDEAAPRAPHGVGLEQLLYPDGSLPVLQSPAGVFVALDATTGQPRPAFAFGGPQVAEAGTPASEPSGAASLRQRRARAEKALVHQLGLTLHFCAFGAGGGGVVLAPEAVLAEALLAATSTSPRGRSDADGEVPATAAADVPSVRSIARYLATIAADGSSNPNEAGAPAPPLPVARSATDVSLRRSGAGTLDGLGAATATPIRVAAPTTPVPSARTPPPPLLPTTQSSPMPSVRGLDAAPTLCASPAHGGHTAATGGGAMLMAASTPPPFMRGRIPGGLPALATATFPTMPIAAASPAGASPLPASTTTTTTSAAAIRTRRFGTPTNSNALSGSSNASTPPPAANAPNCYFPAPLTSGPSFPPRAAHSDPQQTRAPPRGRSAGRGPTPTRNHTPTRSGCSTTGAKSSGSGLCVGLPPPRSPALVFVGDAGSGRDSGFQDACGGGHDKGGGVEIDYNALAAALLATDHCGRLRSARSRFRVTRVERVANPVLAHAFGAKRVETSLRWNGGAGPSRGNADPRTSGPPPLPRVLLPTTSCSTSEHHAAKTCDESSLLSGASVQAVGSSPPQPIAAFTAPLWLSHRLPGVVRNDTLLPSLYDTEKENSDRGRGPSASFGNPGAALNEVYLLHGTSDVNANVIADFGFDERVSNVAGLFGAGIYLTNTLCKSHKYSAPRLVSGVGAGSFADGGGSHTTGNGVSSSSTSTTVPCHERVVIVCRAILGEACVATQSMRSLRRPPARGSVGASPLEVLAAGGCGFYDSVIGNGKDHKEFVVYDRAMVLPYLVVRYCVDDW